MGRMSSDADVHLEHRAPCEPRDRWDNELTLTTTGTTAVVARTLTTGSRLELANSTNGQSVCQRDFATSD